MQYFYRERERESKVRFSFILIFEVPIVSVEYNSRLKILVVKINVSTDL